MQSQTLRARSPLTPTGQGKSSLRDQAAVTLP